MGRSRIFSNSHGLEDRARARARKRARERARERARARAQVRRRARKRADSSRVRARSRARGRSRLRTRARARARARSFSSRLGRHPPHRRIPIRNFGLSAGDLDLISSKSPPPVTDGTNSQGETGRRGDGETAEHSSLHGCESEFFRILTELFQRGTLEQKITAPDLPISLFKTPTAKFRRTAPRNHMLRASEAHGDLLWILTGRSGDREAFLSCSNVERSNKRVYVLVCVPVAALVYGLDPSARV